MKSELKKHLVHTTAAHSYFLQIAPYCGIFYNCWSWSIPGTFYLRNCIVHLSIPNQKSKGIICDQQSWNEVEIFYVIQDNSATQDNVESFCSYSVLHSYLHGNSVSTVFKEYTIMRTALYLFVLLAFFPIFLFSLMKKKYLNE